MLRAISADTFIKPRRAHRRCALLACLAGMASAPVAHADIAAELNAVRLRGCDNAPGAPDTLRQSSELDAVAREWSRGGRLHDAIARTRQRLTNSASMHARGAMNERVLVETLVQHNCETLLNAAYTEIGVYRRGDAVWVVVAERLRMPTQQERNELQRRALSAVNAARAETRRCGDTDYPPAPPLAWSAPLARAAQAHATDMASRSRFDHRGSDGSEVADRVTRAAYRWRHVGENIAAGVSDVESAVAGWLQSAGHCANIMDPRYAEMGVAYEVSAASEAGIYWAQVFATPR
jgi:uncharacterized protein YkwD